MFNQSIDRSTVRFWRRILTGSALLFPSLASAAGMEYPDNGTIAIGRGGAHAANPEDGLAFQYNPAGLAWNDKL